MADVRNGVPPNHVPGRVKSLLEDNKLAPEKTVPAKRSSDRQKRARVEVRIDFESLVFDFPIDRDSRISKTTGESPMEKIRVASQKRVHGEVEYNDREFAEIRTVGIEARRICIGNYPSAPGGYWLFVRTVYATSVRRIVCHFHSERLIDERKLHVCRVPQGVKLRKAQHQQL
jgi:hypothetical protein